LHTAGKSPPCKPCNFRFEGFKHKNYPKTLQLAAVKSKTEDSDTRFKANKGESNYQDLRNLLQLILPILIKQNKATDFQKTATT
jgi:hypothetical protein